MKDFLKDFDESLIDKLVDEVRASSKKIQKVKVKDSSLSASYEDYLNQIDKLRGRKLFYPYVSYGIGNGPYVKLLDGSVKLDFICGIGPHILGHSNPDMIKASLKGSLEDTVMQGHLQMGTCYKDLLDLLIEIASKNSRLKHAWICPSGSMANENALKVIRQKQNGKRKILAFEDAFAGRTTLMAEITDNDKIKVGLPSYDEVLRVPFSPEDPGLALQALKTHYEREGEEISCFIMELMQGDGGYFKAEREFFVPLMEFCKSKGIAIWLDEIQTFARSGNFFAFETLNLGDYVDVCTVGKTLQMSVSFWTSEYNPKPGLVSGTFASSNSSFHTAITLIKKLKPLMGKGKEMEKIGQKWEKALKELEKKKLLSNIQGWGCMWGATPFNSSTEFVGKLVQILFEEGLICFFCGKGEEKRLRFLIPVCLEDRHIKEAGEILDRSLRKLS